MRDNNHTRVLVPAFDINRSIYRLAKQIWVDYQAQPVKKIEVVQVLEGAAIPTSDLVRALDEVSGGELEVGIQSMKVGSYEGTRSTGRVKLLLDVQRSLRGEHVLLTEDIRDTGLTLAYIREHLLAKGPASLKICVFFDKDVERKAEVPVDYIGIPVPNKFVVGYGLDFDGRYRNKRSLLELSQEPDGK